MRARPVLAALVAIVAAGAMAGPAQAQISWTPCVPAGFQCGRLSVPIDRSGTVPGAISLALERVPASSNPTRSAVVGLAGGPGQAALPAATEFARIASAGLASRDLLVFDQRGTGASNRLRCAAFESPSLSLVQAVTSCANQLGPARGFFRTGDTVDDLEAIRQQAGYDKLALLGVSYGTKVALDYAARYPANVEALVLDSIVPPEGSDVFSRSTFQAIGRVLGEVCSGGACAGISHDPLGDLRALVRKTAARSISGPVNDPGGHTVRVSLTPLGLFEILAGGDLNPTLRADLPGSLHSALRGDVRPILRLRARAEGLTGILSARDQASLDTSDSDALFAATRCEESAFPWDRGARPTVRARQAVAAARAIPRSQLDPFNADVALYSDVIPICVGWPNAAPAPAPPAPLPAVPALLLDGNQDLRTPLSDAQSVAQRLPGSRLVTVPFTGHSVLGSEFGTCAQNALDAFFRGTPPPACQEPRLFAPSPVTPTRLSRLPGRTQGTKTVAALRETIGDILRQFIGDAIAAEEPTPAGSYAAGLRSGTALWTESGISFRRVEYVPGVTVTGFLPHNDHATARLTIGGRAAARGIVRRLASGRIVGRLGGRRVSVAAAAAAVAGPRSDTSWPLRVARHPALARAG